MFGWFDELKKWLSGGQQKPQQKQVQQPQAQRPSNLVSVPGIATPVQQQKPKVVQPATPAPVKVQTPKAPQINLQANIQQQSQENANKIAQIKADQQARMPKVYNQQGQQQWIAKDNAKQAQQRELQQKITDTQNKIDLTKRDINATMAKDATRNVIQSAPMPVRRAVAGVSGAVGKLPSDIASGVGAVGATFSRDGSGIDKKFKEMNKWGTETSRTFDKNSAQLYNKDSDGFLGDVVQGGAQLGGDIATMFAPGGAAKLGAKAGQIGKVAPKVSGAINKTAQVLSNPAKVSAIPSARYGLQETGDQYYSAKEAGKSDLQAGATGIAAGATQYGLEKVGLDKILRPGQGNFAASMAKRALTEGAQESAQTFGSNAWEKTYNGDKNLMDDVLRSAAVGAVVGGGASPLIDAGNRAGAQSPQEPQQTAPKITNVAPKSDVEHRAAVDNGIVTPQTARSSVDDMIRTAENSDLSPTAQNTQYRLADRFNAARDFYDNIRDDLSPGGRVSESIGNIRDTISDAGLELQSRMQSPNMPDFSTIRDNISELPGNIRDQIGMTGENIADAYGSAVDTIGGGIDNITDSVQSRFTPYDQSNPYRNVEGELRDMSDDIRLRAGAALQTGQISDAQYADIMAQHDAMFGPDAGELQLMDRIVAPGGEALGATVDNLNAPSDIQLTASQANSMDTYFHEAVHKALNDYMTTPERNALIQSYAKDKRIEQGKVSGREHLRRTEELMAEDFIQYVANQNNKEYAQPPISKRIADVFARVLQRIQQVVLRSETDGTLTPGYLQFYKDLHEGKFASREVIDKQLRDSTPEELAIRDHIQTLQQQFDTTQDSYARQVINQQIAGLNQEISRSQNFRTMDAKKRDTVARFKSLLKKPARSYEKFGKVSANTANIVSQYSGEQVQQDADIEVQAGYARHFNKHTRDALPITDADIANLPEIINSPDSYGLGDFVRGHQRVYLSKDIDGDTRAYVEVIKEGNALNVVTFFKKPSRVPDAMPQGSRPKRGESATNNIANKPRIVKGKRFREAPKMTREYRNAIDDEIARTNPELFYAAEDLALGEGGQFDMPRLHVDDIRHYFGQAGLESIPTRYKRRDGKRDIDTLAASAGYDDVDSFVEAMQRNLDTRRGNRENKAKLAELRKDTAIRKSAQKKIDKKRSDAESAINEFTNDRKEALARNDREEVAHIEELIRAVEKEAGLDSKVKFAKRRQVNVGGPRSKVTEYVASSYKNDNNKDVSELIPLDRSKHTLKNGTVVDKDGRNVGSYVGIDELGQQYAYLQGKPVNITGILGDIDMWGNMNKNTWDMDRMIERNAPNKEVARRVQKFTTVFKDRQESQMKTEIVQRRTKLAETEAKLVKNLPKGISKETLTQDLFRIMERKISYEEVLERYGKDYIEKYIKPTIEHQRKEFDAMLEATNKSLVSNGFDEIPRRDNYISHIQEDPKFWEKVGLGISEVMNMGSSINADINPGKVRGAIPEEIVGNTANTSARRKWNPFAQTRRGSAHQQDFFAAVDAYYEPMLFNQYMTPAASRARLIERTFRTFEKAKEIRAEELLDVADMGTARDMAGLNKQRNHKQYKADRTAPFVLAWQEYGNKLAGKSNKWDRAMLESGNGQKILTASTKLQGITGANTIPGSATAALAQTLSLPQTFARDNPKSFIKAIKDTTYYSFKKNPVSKDGVKDPLMSSSFMRARYTDASSKRKTLMRKYTDKASVPMEAIERFTAEISWRSAFSEARKKGLKFDDAVKEADIVTKQTLAGRGIGDRPLAMDSKAAGALTQFGLEVNNMRLQFWSDFTPMQKSKFILGAFALNWVYGQMTAQTPLPDYLQATIDSFMDMLGSDDEDDSSIQGKLGGALQRYAGETAKFVPGAGAMANLLPEKVREGMFGSDSDVSRFGTMALMKVPEAGWKALEGVMTGDMKKAGDAALMVTPTGQQARRSIEGVSTMANGAAKTSTGNLTTTVDNDSPLKWIQALFFGKNSLSEVQGVYDNKSFATTKDQTKIYDQIKTTAGKDAANEYLDRIRTSAGGDGESESPESNATTAELRAELDLKIEKGDRYIKDGIVYTKDDAVDRAYYKEKAKALKGSKSEEAYRAYLEGYNLTTGTKYGKEKDVSTGSDLLDSLINSESKTSAKSNSAAGQAISLFMDSEKYKNVPDWVKDKYYKDAGFEKRDVEYGALTKVKAETKLDMLYRPIAEKDHNLLLDTLWGHRKMSINNNYVAATDKIITELQKEGYLSKAEAKTLKAAKLDKDMNNTKTETASSRSGSGKKSSGSGTRGSGKTDYTKSDIDAYIKSLTGSDSNDVADIVAKYSGKKFTSSFRAASAGRTKSSRTASRSKKAKVQLG